jgi:hypothetical protein
MTDPADIAAAVADARQKLAGFASECSEEQWGSSPLGDADPRPVCVIVDHVADAYEYIGGWLRSMLDGESLDITSDDVDHLNAHHASIAVMHGRSEVIEHLDRSGDQLIELISALRPDQLAIDNGRLERLAMIASRHADGHRSELEAALAF